MVSATARQLYPVERRPTPFGIVVWSVAEAL
jgi:hypothetical protein